MLGELLDVSDQLTCALIDIDLRRFRIYRRKRLRPVTPLNTSGVSTQYSRPALPIGRNYVTLPGKPVVPGSTRKISVTSQHRSRTRISNCE